MFCGSDQAAGKCFEKVDLSVRGSVKFIPFSRILRFNSCKNIKCFFRNPKRFQILPLVWGRLSRQPWAFCEFSLFSKRHRRDELNQFSWYPEKLSSKPPWNIWCLFANAKQFLNRFGLVVDEFSKLEHIQISTNRTTQNQNPTELKSFHGMLNFYGKFMPNLSSIMEQLHSLLGKDVVGSGRWNSKKHLIKPKTSFNHQTY